MELVEWGLGGCVGFMECVGAVLGRILQFDLQKKKMGQMVLQMVGGCNPPYRCVWGWVGFRGFRCVEGVSGYRNLCIRM